LPSLVDLDARLAQHSRPVGQSSADPATTMPPKQDDGQGQAPAGGSLCLWMVTVLLLLSLLAGGGCLAGYILLPPHEAPAWLPAVGLALVALPWAFWILTCAYRCVAAHVAERRMMAVAPVASASMRSRSGS